MRRPFRDPSFRRLFAGRVVTNVGDSVYFVAAMWLVYRLTNDPLYTGVAGFLTLAPSGLQFLVGPLVDRWSIRRTLTGTQAIQALVVLIVPIAHHFGVLTVGLVLLVMPTLSALNQFVYPAQTAALPRLLDDEELVAANSAFSLAYQGVEMVANGLSGALIGLLGAVIMFAIDAVTFGIAAVLFATVAVPDAGASTDGGGERVEAADGDTDGVVADGGAIDELDGYLHQLRAGGRFLRGTFLVPLIAGAAVVNFTAGMVLAAMPAYADALAVPPVIGTVGGAGAYGVLMAAFAAGNFLGAVGANVVADRPLGVTMIVGFLANGFLWTAAIVVGWLPMTATLIVLALLPAGVVNVQLAAVVQAAPPERFVGRISSVLGSATAAAIPFGALAGGAVAGMLGSRVAMGCLGIGATGFGIYVLAHTDLRRLPPVDQVDLG